jgi:hypothetical protein
MTPNDKQIDLLMKRYTRRANGPTPADHLDTDEMNTFAEGKLSPATRARYVSHLADCDQCRQQVAQLALSGGAVLHSHPSVADKSEHRTLWQVFTGLFALPVLRYAAFAAVLLMVTGVSFLVLRGRHNGDLVAVSQPNEQQPASAVKAPVGEGNENSQASAARAASSPAQTTTGSDQNPKRDESRVAENISPPQPTKEAPAPGVFAEKKAGESEAIRTLPSYAPPPPGETQTATREQQSVGGAGTVAGLRKPEPVDKAASADRPERDVAKDAVRVDDANRAAQPQSVAANRKAVDEKAKGGPSRNFDLSMNRSQTENRAEPPKTQSTGADSRTSTEESAEKRSAGGHKFRRQGKAWIDQKFKSSMTLKSVARGSDEFNTLDSGLRSIAQQLGGEVIVVWKGKAYLIR